jgi:hypothetical protein
MPHAPVLDDFATPAIVIDTDTDTGGGTTGGGEIAASVA